MTTSNTLFARTAVVALFCAAAFAVQAEDTMSKDMDMNMDMSNMTHSTDTMNSKQMVTVHRDCVDNNNSCGIG